MLFNPKDDWVDFVEIYYHSNKIIDLQSLNLASYRISIDTITYQKNIVTDIFLILPEEYFVLNTDSAKVKKQYHTNNTRGFIQMPSLPAYNNDEGIVYTDKMYFLLLKATEGGFLERISFDGETKDPSNCHSTAESVGFATPVYQNSEFISASQ